MSPWLLCDFTTVLQAVSEKASTSGAPAKWGELLSQLTNVDILLQLSTLAGKRAKVLWVRERGWVGGGGV